MPVPRADVRRGGHGGGREAEGVAVQGRRRARSPGRGRRGGGLVLLPCWPTSPRRTSRGAGRPGHRVPARPARRRSAAPGRCCASWGRASTRAAGAAAHRAQVGAERDGAAARSRRPAAGVGRGGRTPPRAARRWRRCSTARAPARRGARACPPRLRSRRFAAAMAAWRALAMAPPADDTTGRARALPIEARGRRPDPQGVPADGPRRARDRRRQPGRGAARAAQARQGAALPARAVRRAVPGRRRQAEVKALKDLQDVLGRFQDRSVQGEALRADAMSSPQPGGPMRCWRGAADLGAEADQATRAR